LSAFSGNWDRDKQDRFKQLNVLLVCNAMGGPCTYIGRTMPASHQGMGINDARFDQVAGHLVATLGKFKVPKKEKKELLDIVGSLRGQIVEKR
jgi:hemoglobin